MLQPSTQTVVPPARSAPLVARRVNAHSTAAHHYGALFGKAIGEKVCRSEAIR